MLRGHLLKFYPAENLGYFDTIQAFFLELTGRGMTLSGRDVELLLRWRDQGASAAVVCRGIDQAVSSMADRPRDIWACRYHIEPLVEKARKSAAGGNARDQTPAPDTYARTVLEEAIDKIERFGEACEREELKEIYRRAWRRLQEVDPEDPLGEIAALEDDIAREFFEALDSSERQAVDSEIRAAQGAYLKNMSSSAREQHIQAQRKKILADRYELPTLL